MEARHVSDFRAVSRRRGELPVSAQVGAGDVIALSDGYQTRSGAEEAIEAIRQSAATAFIDDRARLAPLEASLRDGD